MDFWIKANKGVNFLSKLKQYQFWVSLVIGLVLFVGTYPFYHDIYIAEIHTFICILLNAFSSILFSTFLYCKWTNGITTNSITVFLFLTIIQAIGQGVFAIMNWGSFLFLPLSAIVFVILLISYFKK